MNIVLLGYPGSGKGTQAKVLAQRLGLAHLSTGDIFREEIANRTPLGLKVSGFLSAGKLVPDSVVMEVIADRAGRSAGGVLFDGFPRTVQQAEGLDAFFAARGQKIDSVVFLDVKEEEVIKRLSSRLSCRCGRVYNSISNPPKKAGLCDSCGAELSQRPDDRPEVVAQRLEVYKGSTRPLIDYYRSRGVFTEVDGQLPPAEITERIAGLLGARG